MSEGLSKRTKVLVTFIVVIILSLVISYVTKRYESSMGADSEDILDTAPVIEPTEVVGVVGDTKYTMQDLEDFNRHYSVTLLDSMLRVQVTEDVARELGVEITDDELESLLGELVTKDAYAEWLGDSTLDDTGFKIKFKQAKLLSRMTDKIEDLEVDDSEVERRFIQNPSKYESVDLLEIVVSDKETAKKVVTRLKEGKTRNQIVKEFGGSIAYSGVQERVNSEFGGLGEFALSMSVGDVKIAPDDLVIPFDKRAEGLVGVYKVIEERRSFNSVSNVIKKEVFEERAREAIDGLVDYVMDSSYVENKLLSKKKEGKDYNELKDIVEDYFMENNIKLAEVKEDPLIEDVETSEDAEAEEDKGSESNSENKTNKDETKK